jgi:hypothetical protein
MGASEMREDAIERPGHAREVQRIDQQPRVAGLPAAVGADEPSKLRLAAPSSPGRLLLERAERSELTLALDDLFHSGGAKAADQLLLQVGDADVEPECFHVGATQVGTEAGPLQTTPDVGLLASVAQARQPDVQAPRTEPLEEASDVPCTAHRHDGNAFRGKVSTTASSQRLERDLVASPLDQHNRPWVDAGTRRRRYRQLESLLIVHPLSLDAVQRGAPGCAQHVRHRSSMLGHRYREVTASAPRLPIGLDHGRGREFENTTLGISFIGLANGPEAPGQ